ncbi:MAG: glycosyltransferase family 2 protein [Lachnospiraceae bacterium]|nr:glycosyltransferase family 2 protein [Lachnospiraceae bacterium]
MKQLVSVIIPVYNVQDYLDKCIDSIVNQTYNNLQIIIVDDGSTDNSGRLCDNWAKEDGRILIIHKENGGLSDARNEGLKYVKGEYIVFVDSDDYIHRNMIYEMLQNINQYACEIAICNRYYEFSDGLRKLRYGYRKELVIMDVQKAVQELLLCRYFDMAAWAKMFKFSLFENIRFPKGKLSEDYYIMYLLFSKAKRIVYFDTPLYYYLQRNGSISKNVKLNLDYVEAARQQRDFVSQNYPDLSELADIAYANSNMTVYNIVLNHKGCVSRKMFGTMKKRVKNNLNLIIKNKDITIIKKIQAFLFVYMLPMYNITYRILKRVKKV